ncbi:TonB-dependent receptor [Ramlibacter sp. G-1-2-2]|uniref:TonB-dependent receptor n=1 Tax=Ramlibacter agri TaxID=2728837 RepID=A0A848H634_9BURK|nr:TonB-dependent receptor [Ramlibacter agri]NML45302.1 TonB-dependent receptor [Ramlibacter agri]
MTTTTVPPFARALLAAAAAFAAPALFAQTTPTLAETRVTATRFPELERTLPFGVSVITADQIRASGATNVNDAIVRLLGVPGRQDLYGGGEYNLDLRGFGTTADQNQVVVLDGVRISEADLGGTRISGIPIESVERIEVLRGSGAVLYGEGATGGVIAITTKSGSGRQQPNSAYVYGGVGSFATTDLRAGATVGGNGFSLDANAQKRKTDNYRDNFASDSDAVSATGQWSNDWLRLGARLAQDNLDTGLPGALTAQEYAQDPHQASTPNDHAHIRNERASVFGNADVGNWQLAFDAGHRTKALRSLNSGFPFDYDIAADNYGVRGRNQGRIAGLDNVLVLGVDVDDWQRDTLGSFPATATQQTRSFYAKDDVILAGGTRISLGGRHANLDKNDGDSGISDGQNAWELGVSHPFTPAFTGYARAGRSFRLPNVDEFNFTTPGVALQPQTSNDAEIGARFAWHGGQLDARLYRSLLKNEIGFDPNAVGPFGPFGANVNFDPTRRQGLEVDAQHALTRTVGMRVNAAWREATFRSGPYAGNDIPLAPHATLAVRADWTPVANQRVSGGVAWVSSQHPDFANTCSMPSYTTADARYAITYKMAEFALGVTNLFDRKYYTQAFGCVAGTTTSIYPEAGRAFTASVRVQF